MKELERLMDLRRTFFDVLWFVMMSQAYTVPLLQFFGLDVNVILNIVM